MTSSCNPYRQLIAILSFSLPALFPIAAADEPSAPLRTLVSKVCEFQIDMPRDPTHATSDPASRTTAHKFTAGTRESGRYSIDYRIEKLTKKPQFTVEELEEQLGDFVEQFEKDLGIKVTRSAIVNDREKMGFEVIFVNDKAQDLTARMQVLFTTRRPEEAQYYTILASGPSDFMKSEQTSAFFNSFKLLTSPPAATDRPPAGKSTDAQDFAIVTSGQGYLQDKEGAVVKSVPFYSVLLVTSRDDDVFIVNDGLRINKTQVQFSGNIDYVKQNPGAARKAIDLLSEASVADDEGERDTAISLVTRALEQVKTDFQQDVALSALCMQYLAWLQYANDDLVTANATLDSAEAVLEAIGQPRHLHAADVFNTRGLIRADEGEDAVAIRLFHEALLIQRADLGSDHMDVATVLGNMSYAYENMGEAAQAARVQLISTRTKVKGLPKEAIEIPEAYDRLAGLYHDFEEYEKAIGAYRSAAEYYRTYHTDQPESLADIHLLIGDTFRDQESYESAEKAYLEALPVLAQMDEQDALAWRKAIFNRQGLLDQFHEAYPKALAHHSEAQKLYDLESPTREDGDTFELIGDTYAALDDKNNAKLAYRKALKIFAETEGETSDEMQRVDGLIGELDGATDGTLDDIVLVGEMPGYMIDDDGNFLAKVLQLTVLGWNIHTDETETRYEYYTASYDGEFGNVDATQLRSGRMLPGYFEASADDFKTAVKGVSIAWNALLKNDTETAAKELAATVEHCKATVGANCTLTLWVQMFQIRLQLLTDGPDAAAAALTALKSKIQDRPKGDYPIEMDARAVAGTVLLAMGEAEAAVEKYRSAQEIAVERLGEYHVDVMDLSTNLAKALQESGDIDGAAEELRRAVEIGKAIYPDDVGEVVTTQLALCVVLTQTDDVKEALELVQKITDDADDVPPQIRIMSFVILARANMLLERYDNARELLPVLQTQLKELGASTSPPAAIVLSDLGRLAIVDEQWDAAVKHLTDAVTMNETVGKTDTFEYGKAQLSLGVALAGKGDEQAARMQFAAAVETFAALNRTERPEAKEAARRLSKIKPTPIPPTPQGKPAAVDEASALKLKAAGDAFESGRFEDAKQIFERLLKAAGDDDAAPSLTRATAKLGIAKLSVKPDIADYDFGPLESAIRDLAKLESSPGLLREASLLLAYLRVERGDRSIALRLLESGPLSNMESLRPEQQVTALCLKSRALYLPTRALRADSHNEIREAVQLARTAHQKASEAFGSQHIYCHSALEALGHAQLADGQDDEAQTTFDASRQILRSYINDTVAYQSFGQMASFLSGAKSSLHDALSPLRSHETLQWVLNEKTLLTRLAARDGQVQRLLKSNDQRQAYKTWKQQRSQQTDVSPAASLPKDSLFAEVLEQAQDKNQVRGAAIDVTLSKFPADAQTLLTEPAGPYITVDDVRNALKPDELLIEIVRLDASSKHQLPLEGWSDEDYHVWFVPPAGKGDVSTTSLGNGLILDSLYTDEVIPIANKVLQAVKEKGEETTTREFQQSLRQTARLVLEPIVDRIPESTKTIIFSVDGELQHIAWAALPNKNTGHMLIEDYAIRYVSSGRELVQKSNAAGERGQSVILANPDFDAQVSNADSTGPSAEDLYVFKVNVPSLPGTELESRAILSNLTRFAGSPPKRLTGQDATQSALFGFKNPYVVHLATHSVCVADEDAAHFSRGYELTESGILLEQKSTEAAFRNPLFRCGLLLAGANHFGETPRSPDSILTGEEIVAQDLRGTELVVLSGCPSHLKTIGGNVGAGVLPTAFRLAGVKTVIAPTWEIDDRGTTVLMNKLYENLAGGMSKTEAMRQAQLSVIKSRTERYGAAHPFYWAAFRVNGLE